MQSKTQANKHIQQQAARYYRRFAGIIIFTFLTLLSFFFIPGLQDPETGSLPDNARLAMIVFILLFIGVAALLLAFSSSRRKAS